MPCLMTLEGAFTVLEKIGMEGIDRKPQDSARFHDEKLEIQAGNPWFLVDVPFNQSSQPIVSRSLGFLLAAMDMFTHTHKAYAKRPRGITLHHSRS